MELFYAPHSELTTGLGSIYHIGSRPGRQMALPAEVGRSRARVCAWRSAHAFGQIAADAGQSGSISNLQVVRSTCPARADIEERANEKKGRTQRWQT